MWIMVSGPYRSGAADASERARNLAALNEAALALFRVGHVPIIGVNVALPLIEAAGAAAFDEIMMPLSRRWIPFPDTNPALERLFKAGYRLGILSNVDDDLLAGTRKHFTVPFDLIVTAQQVGSYKPADGHFLTARERIGPARWLHAAQSHFHDVTPARRHGIASAWINRTRLARGEPRPDRELHSLTELADWLA
jgi:FMN phosphatase YigB (HAD superfamily)